MLLLAVSFRPLVKGGFVNKTGLLIGKGFCNLEVVYCSCCVRKNECLL